MAEVEELTMEFRDLEYGFFRYCGKIYFAMQRGKWTLHFPVKDGKIARHSDGSNIFPGERISVIPIQNMASHGMKIKQGDDPMDNRFWSS